MHYPWRITCLAGLADEQQIARVFRFPQSICPFKRRLSHSRQGSLDSHYYFRTVREVGWSASELPCILWFIAHLVEINRALHIVLALELRAKRLIRDGADGEELVKDLFL